MSHCTITTYWQISGRMSWHIYPYLILWHHLLIGIKRLCHYLSIRFGKCCTTNRQVSNMVSWPIHVNGGKLITPSLTPPWVVNVSNMMESSLYYHWRLSVGCDGIISETYLNLMAFVDDSVMIYAWHNLMTVPWPTVSIHINNQTCHYLMTWQCIDHWNQRCGTTGVKIYCNDLSIHIRGYGTRPNDMCQW
jgi:hypothetical protein